MRTVTEKRGVNGTTCSGPEHCPDVPAKSFRVRMFGRELCE